MRLVASVIVRNERGRYLDPWVAHLREFTDGIVLLDDASDDNTGDLFALAHARPGDIVGMSPTPLFDVHEGQARQKLLDLTFEADPTHILAIDADEFIADGPALRATLEADERSDVWTLEMSEVWEIDMEDGCLCLREDGGWRTHPVPILYRAPPKPREGLWRIENRALACGRVPLAVSRSPYRTPAGTILHFGWANPHQRQARYDRYMSIDGGQFHNRAHLESIMQPPELHGVGWPAGLAEYLDAITRAATRPPAVVS